VRQSFPWKRESSSPVLVGWTRHFQQHSWRLPGRFRAALGRAALNQICYTLYQSDYTSCDLAPLAGSHGEKTSNKINDVVKGIGKRCLALFMLCVWETLGVDSTRGEI
jgi:hypothetical protein